MQTMRWINVALRALMELGVVAGFAVWGWTTAGGGLPGIGLAVLAPVVGFGLWGLLDFRFAGAAAEALRLAEELAISALAALALWQAGATGWAIGLAVLSLVDHALVYALGGRLLKSRPAAAQNLPGQGS